MLENATPKAAFNTNCLLLGTVVKSQSVQKLEGAKVISSNLFQLQV
jgi:hypothetical protein